MAKKRVLFLQTVYSRYEMVNAETFYFITYNLLLGNLESSAEVSRLSTTSMN